MTATNPRSNVVLHLDKKKPQDVLTQARATCNGMKANPTLFATPNPPIATVESEIQDLETAQEAVATRARGTVATRNAKCDVLITSVETQRMYVQGLCDANPEQAPAIVEAAAMTIAKPPSYVKPVIQAKQGAQSGVVTVVANETVLVGKGVKKKSTFNWQFSPDGGKTWNSVPSTPLADTTISGLTPLTAYSFRVSVTVSRVTGEWSQAVSILVR
jgi:hypothetical protein